MGKYGIGVRVVDCNGDEGVIVDKRKGEREMRYDDTDYGSIWWPKSGLTVLPGKQEAAPGGFRVGDVVTYSDDMVSGVGTIVAEAKESEYDWAVRSSVDSDWFYKDDRFDFHTRQFKAGSLTPWSPSVGQKARGTENPIEYTVTAVNDDGTLDVSCLDIITGTLLEYKQQWVELFETISDAPDKPEPKFKVGDRVKVVKSRWSAAPKGSLGTVRRTADHVVAVAIDGGDGFAWVHSFDAVEHVSLEVGQRVNFAAPVVVTGINGPMVNLYFPDLPPGKNGYALPASALAPVND